MPDYLCMVYGYFHPTRVELSSWDKLYGLQSLKYLLSGPFKKRFANPWSIVTCSVSSVANKSWNTLHCIISRMKEINHVKHLAQCQAHSKHSITFSSILFSLIYVYHRSYKNITKCMQDITWQKQASQGPPCRECRFEPWSGKISHAAEQLSLCATTTEPASHNYWACTLEPMSRNYWAHVPRARTPQQEKPPQWEAHALQRRVAPAHRN